MNSRFISGRYYPLRLRPIGNLNSSHGLPTRASCVCLEPRVHVWLQLNFYQTDAFWPTIFLIKTLKFLNPNKVIAHICSSCLNNSANFKSKLTTNYANSFVDESAELLRATIGLQHNFL